MGQKGEDKWRRLKGEEGAGRRSRERQLRTGDDGAFLPPAFLYLALPACVVEKQGMIGGRMEEARLLCLVESTTEAFDKMEAQCVQHKYYFVEAALRAIRLVVPSFQSPSSRRKVETASFVDLSQDEEEQGQIPQSPPSGVFSGGQDGILDPGEAGGGVESPAVQVQEVEMEAVLEEVQDQAGSDAGMELDEPTVPVQEKKWLSHIEEEEEEEILALKVSDSSPRDRSRACVPLVENDDDQLGEAEAGGSGGNLLPFCGHSVGLMEGGEVDVRLSLDLGVLGFVGEGRPSLPLVQLPGTLKDYESCEIGLMVKAPTCMYMMEGRVSRMASRESGGMVKFSVQRFSKQDYDSSTVLDAGSSRRLVWNETGLGRLQGVPALGGVEDNRQPGGEETGVECGGETKTEVKAGSESESEEGAKTEPEDEITSNSGVPIVDMEGTCEVAASMEWQAGGQDVQQQDDEEPDTDAGDYYADGEGQSERRDAACLAARDSVTFLEEQEKASSNCRGISDESGNMSRLGSSDPVDMMVSVRQQLPPDVATTSRLVVEGEGSEMAKPKRPNVVSRTNNVRSFVSMVKQQAAPPPMRVVKVWALEAAQAAKKQEEQRDRERKMRKEQQKLLKEQKEDKAKQLRQEESQMKRRKETRVDPDKVALEQSRWVQESDVGSKGVGKVSVNGTRTMAERAVKKKQFTSRGSTKAVLADCSNTCSSSLAKNNRVQETKTRLDLEKARRVEEDRWRKDEEWRKVSDLAAKKRSRQETEGKERDEKRIRQGESMVPYRDQADIGEVGGWHKGDGKQKQQGEAILQPGQRADNRVVDPRCAPEADSLRALAALDLGPPESYEISPYRSSSSDEDDDAERVEPHKPIPFWARSEHLLPQLIRQTHVDPDDIFSSAKTCTLSEVFGTNGSKKKGDFQKRSFSGNWLEDRVTWKEELQYKQMMGYSSTVQSISETRS